MREDKEDRGSNSRNGSTEKRNVVSVCKERKENTYREREMVRGERVQRYWWSG